MCDACSLHRSLDSTSTVMTVFEGYNLLRDQFAELSIFEELGSLPYPLARWSMEMRRFL